MNPGLHPVRRQTFLADGPGIESNGGWRDQGSAGIDPEFSGHDGDDVISVVEQEPLQECGELPKEGDPEAMAEAEDPVAVAHKNARILWVL